MRWSPGLLYIIDLLTIQNIAYYRVGISLVRLIFSHKSNKVSRNLDPAVQWSPYWALMGSPHLRWQGAFPPTSCLQQLRGQGDQNQSPGRDFCSNCNHLYPPVPLTFCWGGACSQIVEDCISFCSCYSDYKITIANWPAFKFPTSVRWWISKSEFIVARFYELSTKYFRSGHHMVSYQVEKREKGLIKRPCWLLFLVAW